MTSDLLAQADLEVQPTDRFVLQDPRTHEGPAVPQGGGGHGGILSRARP